MPKLSTAVHERCIHCKEQTLIRKGSFLTKEGLRKRYYCKNCKKSTALTRKKFTGKCPLCKNNHVRYSGNYRTLSKPKKRRRYYCYDCKKSFSWRRVNYKGRFDIEIIREIKRLANGKKLVANKYSMYRKSNPEKVLLYTDSDVVKIIRKKFKIKMSRNGAGKLLKKFRKI